MRVYRIGAEYFAPSRRAVRYDVIAIIRAQCNGTVVDSVAACRRVIVDIGRADTENVKPVPAATLFAAGSVIV